jgi:ribonuclease HII
MTILIGIDEAGRGPVIGPMVMCAFAIEQNKEVNLQNLGVKDSKLIPPIKREQLFENLSVNFQYTMKSVTAKEVDDALNDPELNLNWLEAITSANLCNELIKKLGTDDVRIIVDCPSTNPDAYKEYFRNKLDNKDIELIVEHKADMNYLVVGAASIIAKVTRDRTITNLKKEIGIDFGSGYPSDPKTKAFLVANYDKYDVFRKSWASWKKIAKAKDQKTLGGF